MVRKVSKTPAEWAKILTPEQFQVCREKGTERAFTGEYHDCKTLGLYRCSCCDAPLFESQTKFDSGTGWPSFGGPVDQDSVREERDDSLFASRTEVLCSTCDAHLGHVFNDGPEPARLRYCINSVSLKLDADTGE